jgi:hypothetical protein
MVVWLVCGIGLSAHVLLAANNIAYSAAITSEETETKREANN